MFPTLKPLGATKTGRFTSGGGKGSLELNVLAISGRDEHFGMPIRELFLPYHDDEKIVCADFSNQEPRLQVHYAKVLSCAGADLMVKKWNDDPHMKLAKVVAEIAELDYNTAKTLLLGMSYGMGVAKAALKLNISYQAAKTLFNKLYTRIPFLKQLQEVTKQALKKNGYIKTIGGRKLFIDPPGEFNGKISTKEHKGMSKLIQGSGLDQLWASMIAVEEVGLNFMLCVHDEMIISSKAINAEKERDMLVDCMQNSYILYVPVIAEAGIGDNWLQAKP